MPPLLTKMPPEGLLVSRDQVGHSSQRKSLVCLPHSQTCLHRRNYQCAEFSTSRDKLARAVSDCVSQTLCGLMYRPCNYMVYNGLMASTSLRRVDTRTRTRASTRTSIIRPSTSTSASASASASV